MALIDANSTSEINDTRASEQLSKNELISIYNNIYKGLGYDSPVPTIDEFIENPYYLGQMTNNGAGIYPYWREVLRDIYPDPFTVKYTTVLLRGSIG